MNKAERLAIEEAIDLLEYEIRHNGKGFCFGGICVTQENEVTEALKILKGIIKAEGDNHERT